MGHEVPINVYEVPVWECGGTHLGVWCPNVGYEVSIWAYEIPMLVCGNPNLVYEVQILGMRSQFKSVKVPI